MTQSCDSLWSLKGLGFYYKGNVKLLKGFKKVSDVSSVFAFFK